MRSNLFLEGYEVGNRSTVFIRLKMTDAAYQSLKTFLFYRAQGFRGKISSRPHRGASDPCHPGGDAQSEVFMCIWFGGIRGRIFLAETA
jgi:hypothetical protein